MPDKVKLDFPPKGNRTGVYVPLTLLAVCLAHFLLRLLLDSQLGYDDAEQALYSQFQAWIYRYNQPPLYTWGLLPLVDILGHHALTFHLSRQLWIAAFFISAWMLICHLFEDRERRLYALCSLALFFPFVWVIQINLTNTLTLLTFFILSWWAGFKLDSNSPRRPWLWIILLGLFWAGAFLGKYTFAIYWIPQMIALVIASPNKRGRLLLHLLLAAGLAILLSLPHLIAAAQFSNITLQYSQLVVNEDLIGRASSFEILVLILFGTAEVIFPAFIVSILLFSNKALWQGSKGKSPVRTAFCLFTLISLVLVVAVLLSLRGDQIRSHWLIPMLITLPFWIAFHLKVTPFSAQRVRILKVITLTVCGLVALVFTVRELREAERSRSGHRAIDYSVFAQKVDATYGDLNLGIIGHSTLAGNLSLYSQKKLITPRLEHLVDLNAQDEVFFVWQIDSPDSDLTYDPQLRPWIEELSLRPDWPTENELLKIPLGRSESSFRSFLSIRVKTEIWAEWLESLPARF